MACQAGTGRNAAATGGEHADVRDGAPVAVRFDAAPPTTQTICTSVQRGGTQAEVTYRLVSLPLYLVERLPSLLAALAP